MFNKSIVTAVFRDNFESHARHFSEHPNDLAWDSLEEAMYCYQFVYRAKENELSKLLADKPVGYWSGIIMDKIKKERTQLEGAPPVQAVVQ